MSFRLLIDNTMEEKINNLKMVATKWRILVM